MARLCLELKPKIVGSRKGKETSGGDDTVPLNDDRPVVEGGIRKEDADQQVFAELSVESRPGLDETVESDPFFQGDEGADPPLGHVFHGLEEFGHFLLEGRQGQGPTDRARSDAG